MKNTKHLTVKWSTSRGRDTYGYNICKVIDNSSEGKVYKCIGGGYDMLGTSLAQWVQETYQTELMQNAEKSYLHFNEFCIVEKFRKEGSGFYGMQANYKKDIGLTSITLDGGCGINSIERIIKEVLGLTLERIYNYDRKGRVKDVIGFYVYPTET